MTSWFSFVIENVKADFETGQLYWKSPAPGRTLNRPLGSLSTEGYVKVVINRRQCLAHQVVFFLFHKKWPSEIDHINRVRSDNRIINLRECTRSENNFNSSTRQRNNTGVKGVHQTKRGDFQVTVNGKYIGIFSTLETAKKVAEDNYKSLGVIY